MALSNFEITKLASSLKNALVGQHLGKLVQFDESVFVFSLSKSGRLVFCLDNQNPYVYITDTSFDVPSLSTPITMTFKKELTNATIEDIYQQDNDRVIAFTLTVINDVYKEETMTLIAELIPTKANLVLVNESGRVIAVLRGNLITDPRPCFKGCTYEGPLQKGSLIVEDVPFDFASYLDSCVKKEGALEQKRKKCRFKPLYQYLSSKRKAAKKKISLIEQDIEKAKEHLDDGDYGNFIFMSLDAIDVSLGYMDYYGEKIPLDKSKSATANAEAFFKRAKKAKATIKNGEANLERALKEQEEYELLFAMIENADEKMLEKLSKEYGLDNVDKNGKYKTSLSDSASLPYLVKYGETSILFGKNSTQNDILSFLISTNKNHVWMHIKDNHGAHLMIEKENPSNEELTFAAEICLLASKLESGEVMYTLHKFVRRGQVKGQAVVSQYQSAYIKKISDKAKEAYACASKMKLRS